MQRTSIENKLISLTTFGIAMGFLEAVVVVYLRQLYYPEGFEFPLKPMAVENLSIEILRELSTIVMLIFIGIIAGRDFYERLSYLLYSFGIWDIFYYIWLKVLLDWPPSLLTWDILFLIPVVWIGPVLAPVICSLTMITIAGFILYFQKKGYPVKISLLEWVLLSLGSFIIFTTFIWDYAKIIIEGRFTSRFLSLIKDTHFQEIVVNYIPTSYNWLLFILGECLVLCFLIIFFRRTR